MYWSFIPAIAIFMPVFQGILYMFSTVPSFGHRLKSCFLVLMIPCPMLSLYIYTQYESSVPSDVNIRLDIPIFYAAILISLVIAISAAVALIKRMREKNNQQ